MSNECSSIVWKRDFGSATRKVIAARLADHADDEGRGIWPSVERIAAQCNTSCRTVQRTLADFVQERLLKVISEGGRGPGSTTRYDFDMGQLRALPLALWGNDAKGDRVSPLENKDDTGDIKGDTGDGKGCHRDAQTIMEPPLKPSIERARGQAIDASVDAKAIERGFRRAFARWPTFVSDSEPAARKAWHGLSADERGEAVERQADYVLSVRISGRSKFCTFAVYLLEKRWSRLAEKNAGHPRSVPAFGPAWAAICLEKLLAGMEPVGPPDVTRETKTAAYAGMVRVWGAIKARLHFEQQGFGFAGDGELVFPDDFEERQWREHVLTRGFPVVKALYAQAEIGRGLTGTDAQRGELLVPLMEFVVADTPAMAEWQRFYADRCWPFPKVGRRGHYFPAGGPSEIQTFEKAIRNDQAA